MDAPNPAASPRATLPTDLREALFSGVEALPEALERQLVALGAPIVNELLAIAISPDLAEQDAPGDGRAPVHAARLLGKIGDPVAIVPLLAVLQRLDWDDILHDAICLALPRFGGALVEPALAVLAADPPPATREALCVALAETGYKDERIFAHLTALYADDRILGAVAFGLYRDARALPLLAADLRQLAPGPSPAVIRSDLVELVDAYRRIAGALPDDLEAHAVSLREALDAACAAEAGGGTAARSPDFLRHLDRAPRAPWVCAAFCPDPGCHCREATLFFARQRTALDPILSGLAAGEDPRRLMQLEGEDLLAAVTAVVVSLDDGKTVLLPRDGATLVSSSRPDSFSPTDLEGLIDGPLLDQLSDAWCRVKGHDPAETIPVAQLEHTPGNLVPWGEAFHWRRPDVYVEEGRTFELLDHHCPEPECTCEDIMLEWIELSDGGRQVGSVNYQAGAELPPGGGGKNPILSRLWARLRRRYPDAIERFADHRREVKQRLGPLLHARQPAPRPAPKWVPTSGKRKRGQGKR